MIAFSRLNVACLSQVNCSCAIFYWRNTVGKHACPLTVWQDNKKLWKGRLTYQDPSYSPSAARKGNLYTRGRRMSRLRRICSYVLLCAPRSEPLHRKKVYLGTNAITSTTIFGRVSEVVRHAVSTKCPQNFLSGTYLFICDKCAIFVCICKFAKKYRKNKKKRKQLQKKRKYIHTTDIRVHHVYSKTGWRSLLLSWCWWKMYGVKGKVGLLCICRVVVGFGLWLDLRL